MAEFTHLKWGNAEKTVINCTRENGEMVSSPYPPQNWMAESILAAEAEIGVDEWKTAAEILDEKSQEIRIRRDALLAACDWTVLSDSPLETTVKAAWVTYRQALRDITEQPTFPESITWPTAP